MKRTINRVERYRVKDGRLRSTKAAGRNGAFLLPARLLGRKDAAFPMTVICSDGSDWDPESMGPTAWEHVSASWPDRCPTWEEMCIVKDLFWNEGECVLQFHPPKRDYVNVHPHCLHLWKPIGEEIHTPPALTVGHKATALR